MSTRSYDKEREHRSSRYRDEERHEERYQDQSTTRSRREDTYPEERDRHGYPSSRGDDGGKVRSTARDYDDRPARYNEEPQLRRSRQDEESYYNVSAPSRVDVEQKWAHDRYERLVDEEPRYRPSVPRPHRSSDAKTTSARRSPTPDYKALRERRPRTPEYASKEAKEKRPLDSTHTRARSITPSPSPGRTATVHSDDDSDFSDRRSRSPRRRDVDLEKSSRKRRHYSGSYDKTRSPDRELDRRRRSSNSHQDSGRYRDTETERDRERRKERKKARKEKEKEEKRSVLTGKKIKLKVHKDAEDIERDKKREDLLQFLNSAYS